MEAKKPPFEAVFLCLAVFDAFLNSIAMT